MNKNTDPITITIFENPDQWLRKNLPDMTTDNVACVVPVGRCRPGEPRQYHDREEGTKKECSWQDHIDALQRLCEQVGVALFVGGIKSPRDLADPGNWDAEVVDAYYQLVYRGEVIYG